MSDETLKQFLERLSSDEAFKERMTNNSEAVEEEADLSEAELVALGTQDEDALRRLVGAEVTGHALSWFITPACTYGCRPPSTAGSGQGCGTGPRGTGCCGTPGSGQGCGTGRCVVG
jgi:hypothetical protein